MRFGLTMSRYTLGVNASVTIKETNVNLRNLVRKEPVSFRV